MKKLITIIIAFMSVSGEVWGGTTENIIEDIIPIAFTILHDDNTVVLRYLGEGSEEKEIITTIFPGEKLLEGLNHMFKCFPSCTVAIGHYESKLYAIWVRSDEYHVSYFRSWKKLTLLTREEECSEKECKIVDQVIDP